MKKSPLKKKTPLKNRGAKLKKNRVLKKKGVVSRKRNIAKKVSRRVSSPLWNAIKRCDTAYSQYIRLLHADKKGQVKCYTCEFKAFWKKSKIENGHYMGRSNMTTRWYNINNHPQCHFCNSNLGGNLEVYRTNLVSQYGEKVVEHLEQEARKKTRLTQEKVNNLTTFFVSEVERLKKKLELN